MGLAAKLDLVAVRDRVVLCAVLVFVAAIVAGVF